MNLAIVILGDLLLDWESQVDYLEGVLRTQQDKVGVLPFEDDHVETTKEGYFSLLSI